MLIFVIILFLLLSALFSGTEIAFISGSKLRVELSRKKGTRQGKILAGFYENPADFLGTMLVGNNIALVVFTYLMTKVLEPFLEQLFPWKGILLLVNTLIITVIVLIFGEFLPKTLFRVYADRLLYILAFPLKFIQWILMVPSWITTKLSNFLLRYVLKAPIDQGEDAFTRIDLEDFINNTNTEAEEPLDKELFAKALNLKKVKVKECMIPRTEIVEIDIKGGVEELQQVMIETKLSRIIVTKNDLDHILGYVHHQQMWKKPDSIGKIIMPLPIVPETMRVRDLMNKFIKERNSMAWVVDEYGGTAGIITLEDIVEEIFGEIEDEHDQEEYVENQISDIEYIFSGRLELDYLNEKYENLDFPEGEYHTLSGYLVMTTATIPEQGDIIDMDGYRFFLELVSETKIETVRVIKLNEDQDEETDR